MEKAAWLICIGITKHRDSGNLLDFLIRWLKTAKSVNDNFRFWIICEGIDALNLTTVQKCISHFLGHEAIPEIDPDNPNPIFEFQEAKEK